jgi:HEAT repeat protein
MVTLLISLLLARPQAVDQLIENLGSDEIGVREDATSALRRMGEKAIPALQKSLNSVDTEVRARASDLLAAFAGVGQDNQIPRTVEPQVDVDPLDSHSGIRRIRTSP